MTVVLQVNQALVVAGLGNFSYTVPSAGVYSVIVKSTIPLGSSLEIVLRHNNHVVVDNGGVASNPTPTQTSIGAAMQNVYCAVNDTLSVQIASTSAVDAAPNAVKSTINLFDKFLS